MSAFVVDASVALKWYVTEADSDIADDLLSSPCEFFAPELLKVELANGLRKNHRKGLIDDRQARLSLSHLASAINMWRACDPYLEDAFALAAAMNHPIYDCIYLCLARALGVPCVTTDRRLIDRVAGTFLAAFVVPLSEWRA